MTDIEIAQRANMLPITEVAKNCGILDDELELYGKYKAKISPSVFERMKDKPKGKLVLVTAITPTPAGEGKSTTTIGLACGLNKIGKKAIAALREPSLGPVFGVKGGAAGGGYAQVVPMEDINLHFTGDFHAITAANNLLCAAIDNHFNFGNELNIDPRRIVFKRVMDMNDRSLRQVVIGLGGKANGFVREDSFSITVASEVMAILCLAEGLSDLKQKLGNIVCAYNLDGEPVRASDLKVHGAMAALLKEAIKPNLVQTLENTPAIIHGGPFANIAHGCNSIIATKLALTLGEYAVTEAGFGSDLGAEKFIDIKCRKAGLSPDVVVVVATVRALKMHGGVSKKALGKEDVAAMEKGFCNLKRHLDGLANYGVPAVVAINRFSADTAEEVNRLIELCKESGIEACVNNSWELGGEGAVELSKVVVAVAEKGGSKFSHLYSDDLTIEEKINTIIRKVYCGKGAIFSAKAKKELSSLPEYAQKLPVCMAKTQYSLSDDATRMGAPEGFEITVADIRLSAGAGFVVALCGDIMTMPGLPKVPSAEAIDIDENGNIVGLF